MKSKHVLSVLVLILNIFLINSENLIKNGNKTRLKSKGHIAGVPRKFKNTKFNGFGLNESTFSKPHIKKRSDGCWFASDVRKLFQELNRIEDTYSGDISKFETLVRNMAIDKNIKVFFESIGPETIITQTVGEIPAGLSFGGHSIVENEDSLRIFYGMKLRNNTKFIIKQYTSDWNNMTVSISLSFNDLHLMGDYDRSLLDNRNGSMIFKPYVGKSQLLVKGAVYNMEGRYRLSSGKLMIEHVISKMMNNNEVELLLDNETQWTLLPANKTEDLLMNMQIDLEKWLKEYFNFRLTYIDLQHVAKYQEYAKVRELFLNQYLDYVIKRINKRLHILKLALIKIPEYEMITTSGTEFRLVQGFVEGLDTMYRRSTATARGNDRTLVTNADIAFSNLKVYYKYETVDHSEGLVQKSDGTLILQADDLIAHLQLAHVKKLANADITIASVTQTKNAVLVEGSPEKYTTSFKHLLKQNIYALMSKVLTKAVLSINAMPKCRALEAKTGRHPKLSTTNIGRNTLKTL